MCHRSLKWLQVGVLPVMSALSRLIADDASFKWSGGCFRLPGYYHCALRMLLLLLLPFNELASVHSSAISLIFVCDWCVTHKLNTLGPQTQSTGNKQTNPTYPSQLQELRRHRQVQQVRLNKFERSCPAMRENTPAVLRESCFSLT